MNDVSDAFEFHEGTCPLLVSIPHDGREIPASVRSRMTSAGLSIPDTDWHVAKLYGFVADLGASLVTAKYSRYVIDLNRAASDSVLYEGQVSTGLCPTQTFAGEAIYQDDGDISDDEIRGRIKAYWQPYHDTITTTLSALRKQHGYALLWDAHSIPSRVPRLFDGELPVLSIGTYDGRSCAAGIARAVNDIAGGSDFDVVANARFKGGYITRHYGEPDNGIHAVQLEIAQRAYMDEDARTFDANKAAKLRDTLRSMLQTFLDAADEHR